MIATIIAPYCAVLNINSGWNAQNKAFSGYFEPEKGPFLHLGSRYWKGKPTFCEQYHNLYIKLLHGTKKILNRWISIFFQKTGYSMPFSAHIRVPLIPEVSGTLPDQISISILTCVPILRPVSPLSQHFLFATRLVRTGFLFLRAYLLQWARLVP